MRCVNANKLPALHFYLFYSGPPPLSRLSTTGGLLHVAKDMLGSSTAAEGSRLLKIDSGVVDVVEVATLALKCLSHLFTWVPLSTVISPRLLAAIFHFAGLGIPCMNVSAKSLLITTFVPRRCS